MGTPLIVMLLSLGDWCVRLLYADGFAAAVPLLNWMTWGVFLRLFAWPLAYWLLARGSNRTMIIIEGVSAVLMTLLAVALLGSFGLVGCAMGFAFGQGLYAFLLVLVARRRSGAWIGARTWGWTILSAAVCVTAQAFAAARPSGLAAFVPAILSVAVAGFLYLRLLRRP